MSGPSASAKARARRCSRLLDRPALRPLPAERYQYGEWKTARVNIDYHVEFDHHWYSVPYQLTQQEVEIRATAATVEIFHKGIRVASHARSHTPHRHTTIARVIGPRHTSGIWSGRPRESSNGRPRSVRPRRRWSERILASNRHPEQGFRSCLGIIRLGDKYPHARVEAAARRAVALNVCSYQSLKSILENGLDGQAPEPSPDPRPPVDHPNLRGPDYYDTSADSKPSTPEELMLTQPTIDKLVAMRLRGMAEAFREQQESADLQRLSFEERLGLLIDRQWNWRENRALDRRLRNGRLQGPACIEDIDYRTPRGLDRQLVRSLTQESAWVREHQHLFLLGPTGIGKTWLARALAQKACRDGYTALFLKADGTVSQSGHGARRRQPLQAAVSTRARRLCWWWMTGPWRR